MNAREQAFSDTTPGTEPWAVEPYQSRVRDLDAGLRSRLADSFEYLGEILPAGDGGKVLGDLRRRLRSGEVSPWVFGLYAGLVEKLSWNQEAAAAELLGQIGLAASRPAADGVIGFGDASVPAAWWDRFLILLDTDPKRPFRVAAPPPGAFAACAGDVEQALALLDRAAPDFADEVRALLRTIVLAEPEGENSFNGASTFFMWGATLLNAAVRRGEAAMVDLLVHESSHVLLFGVAADQPLTRNGGEERYASPLRKDARPIDGIFHAAFVTTRVHRALDRVLASGRLDERQALEAAEQRRRNAVAARSSLEVLDQHALPTDLGAGILSTLRAYWSSAA